MDKNQEPRIIGFDAHPDSFTAAIVSGQTPAQAICQRVFNKVPMSGLASWAKKHTRPQDTIVLETSGNSFQLVRDLEKLGRTAFVLESFQMGKLKDAHANNDKISAVRIAKAFLSGTAKRVWVPDLLTQQKRDITHAYLKAVRRSTQMRNRIQSYLSDNGVRLAKGVTLDGGKKTSERLQKLAQWNPMQWTIIENYLSDLEHAEEKRQFLGQTMAEAVLKDDAMLSLTRLCGVRDVAAFILMAFIGDIKRFSNPKALVNYIGLTPAFDDSGKGTWTGGIKGHGRKDLRSLLIQSGQAIMRSKHPIASWGRKLMGRKGSSNIAIAAVTRKLVVAIWYCLNGKTQPLTEIDKRLSLKVGKIISKIGNKRVKELGKTRMQLRKETYEKLKTARIYVLEPEKKRVINPKETQPV
jgi:transposase